MNPLTLDSASGLLGLSGWSVAVSTDSDEWLEHECGYALDRGATVAQVIDHVC